MSGCEHLHCCNHDVVYWGKRKKPRAVACSLIPHGWRDGPPHGCAGSIVG